MLLLKEKLCLFFLCLFPFAAFSQSDSSVYKSAIQNALATSHSLQNAGEEIYTGAEHVGYRPFSNGIPYFETGQWHKGSIVYSKGFVLGTSYFNGMASFLTYPETFEGIELDPRAVAVDYESLQLQRIFYSPDYSSPARRSSRIPDLRTTLLWVPEVSSGSLQFYTGDIRGKYIAVLEGLTKEGKPLTATAQFQVQ